MTKGLHLPKPSAAPVDEARLQREVEEDKARVNACLTELVALRERHGTTVYQVAVHILSSRGET